jgi:hypothetical protein
MKILNDLNMLKKLYKKSFINFIEKVLKDIKDCTENIFYFHLENKKNITN